MNVKGKVVDAMMLPYAPNIKPREDKIYQMEFGRSFAMSLAQPKTSVEEVLSKLREPL